MSEKQWWASKTLWFNVLALGGSLAVGSSLSPEQVALGMGIGNAVLRLLTEKKVVF